MYNLSENEISTELVLAKSKFRISEIHIDGYVKSYQDIEDNRASVKFDPHEIKLISIDYAS